MMALRFREALLIVLLWGSGPSLLQAEADFFSFDFEPDVVCRRIQNPARSLCPKLEHLKLRLGLDFGQGTSIRLGYDPQHVSKATWFNTYDLGVQKLAPQKSWLDDYAIRIDLGSEWELSIEDWVGVTLLPDASGLGFSHALQDTGWNQTALRLTWLNPEVKVLAASLIVGQGEGERLEEDDKTPYWGALARIELADSLALQAGISYDEDSQTPASLFWLNRDERHRAAEGFRTTRQAVSLFFDGNHASARGLRLSTGWQQSRIRGPRSPDPLLVLDPALGALDPTELLAEFLGGRSRVERSTLGVSGSYLILAEYILAFNYQELTVDLHEALLRSCQSIEASGYCTTEATNRSKLRLKALTYGFGKKSDSGWSLMVEAFRESYDSLYELYHFAPTTERRQKSLQLLQLRLSWIL